MLEESLSLVQTIVSLIREDIILRISKSIFNLEWQKVKYYISEMESNIKLCSSSLIVVTLPVPLLLFKVIF